MAEIYLDFAIETEQFGNLKFATFNNDREACVRILHCFLEEPKLSLEDIGSLPDGILQSTGRELFIKSGFGDMLEDAKIEEKGFFAVFREAHKQLIEKTKISKVKFIMGIADALSQKSLRNSMFPKTYSAFDYYKHAIRDITDIHSATKGFISEIDKTLIERDKWAHSLGIPSHEHIKDLVDSLRHPLTDIPLTFNEPLGLSSMNLANEAIASLLGDNLLSKIKDLDDSYSAKNMIAEQSRLLGIGDISLAATKMLSDISMTRVHDIYGISSQQITALEKSFHGVSDTYAELFRGIEASKVDITSFDWFITELPPIEVYMGAELARVISKPVPAKDEHPFSFEQNLVEDIEGSLEEMLALLDPNLVRAWQGAKHAMKGDNPDRFRHVTVSLRELLTHVLHKSAPDDEVMKWTSDKQYFHNGRPTRAARLLFICRGVNNGPFAEFMKKDVASNVAFIDVFQKGTHGLNIVFTEPQMEALIVRTESLLRFILTVSQNN